MALGSVDCPLSQYLPATKASRIQPRGSDGQVQEPSDGEAPLPSLQSLRVSRYTLLEALRAASVWRHGGTSSGATPVLPYARLAYTHTLAFLNKVCPVRSCIHQHF